VLSDIVMPGTMNGIELAHIIRRKRPRLPIVLVTGYAASAVNASEFVVLRKPYRFEQLRQAITQVANGLKCARSCSKPICRRTTRIR